MENFRNKNFKLKLGTIEVVHKKLVGVISGGLMFIIFLPLIFSFLSSFSDEKLGMPNLLKEPLNFIVAIGCIGFGLSLVAWSGFAQITVGRGTPIPVMPTQRLITTGSYSLCRNPMLLGTTIYYLGIGFFMNSPSFACLTLLFLVGSAIYIKLVEEKKLEAQFGEEYREYRRNTPFLIPRLGKRIL